MIGTNRDLARIRERLDLEILRFGAMAKSAPEQAWIGNRLTHLSRQRLAICAALVNRRAEASKNVVNFSRWASGNGAPQSERWIAVSVQHWKRLLPGL